MRTISRLGLVLLGACLFVPRPAHATGEGVNGFPNWAERVLLEWTNRARADPQYEMARCGSDCSEAACYQPQAPLTYRLELNRAARFHSDELAQQSYFAHDSACTVVSNIDAIYPGSCNGAASCACVGGVRQCSPQCTTTGQRIALFRGNFTGENIASPTDPDRAFYLWLYEPYNKTTCNFDLGPPTNGHRWNLLRNGPGFGAGVSGPAVTDLGSASAPATKIPSGAHYPRQAASVEAWANWYDPSGAPTEARVNVDGNCTSMTRQRGSDTNGAWSATVSGVGTGCHRYYFVFRDSGNNLVTYPTTGSLGIGPAGSCADWDTTRPPTGASCSCTPDCTNKRCGDDGCGGACGTCTSLEICSNGSCVDNPAIDLRSNPADASVSPDQSVNGDGGLGGGQGACGCRLGGAPSAASERALALFLGLGLALWVRRGIRRSTGSRT